MEQDEDIKQLVVLRLETMPANVKLSIGSHGEFDKDELIARVKKGDEIGKKIVAAQLHYLRSLKRGIISYE
ncbi:hypothetical protein J4448_00405 [Candidatus Woesearchaeota archaeon]|nr:hypothetical protein [Candidatus Woesearchaeota archaeon]